MGDTRQHFDDEFKRQTVKHMQENGKTPSEVSKELDIPASSIRKWKNQFANTGEKSQLFVDYERLKKLEDSQPVSIHKMTPTPLGSKRLSALQTI
ncbi:hypothetical protein PCCS19_07890 [Paenibacillus sp. CCS19]|uniref:transposase n=1 Tax=Paenibacillus sp. CCS19 TaxID=3158387 RepID=UPI002564A98E|nr:transposase [Paenibacillus cellulosilyticus]GMK37735.1 hypothetical protein PCCS19_07890 [Paenibacillus cellulosilyticus]